MAYWNFFLYYTPHKGRTGISAFQAISMCSVSLMFGDNLFLLLSPTTSPGIIHRLFLGMAIKTMPMDISEGLHFDLQLPRDVQCF